MRPAEVGVVAGTLPVAARAVGRPKPGTDGLRVSLLLLLVVTISRIHQHFAVVGRLRPALILAGVAVVWAILDPRALDLRGLFRHWPPKVMLALGVVAGLSAIFGIAPGRSARYLVGEYATVLTFAFLLVAAMRSTRDLRLFVWGYVASSAVLVWMALWVFGLRQGGTLARLDSLYTYDANDVGCVLIVGLPLALLTYQTSARWGKLFSAAVLAGIGAAIARTGSRGAFLGVCAVALALLLSVRRVALAKRLAFVAAVIVALAVAAPPGYWNQIDTLTDPREDYNWQSVDGRVQVWRRGMGYMLQRPVFGVGINNFPRAEGTNTEKVARRRPGRGVRWTAAHSSFVQAGAELGVPGLVLWTVLVVGGVAGPLRLRRRLPPHWARGDRDERFLYLATLYLPVAAVGFGVTAAFLSFAYMDPPYVLAALVTGLYVCAHRRLRGGGAV